MPSSYLMYLDANNLYGWAMCKKLPVDGFKWIDNLSIFTEDVIKYYNKNSNAGYFLEVDIKYPKELFNKQKDLPFLPNREKINKAEKLVTTIEDKEKYVLHIAALKQVLNHGLVLEKLHRVIEFRQEAWLKPYIDMNTKLRTEVKDDFEKDFFKLLNNSVFGKTMENVRNHRDIKLVTTNERRKAILDISKTLIYKFWYDYIKPKYQKKSKVMLHGYRQLYYSY